MLWMNVFVCIRVYMQRRYFAQLYMFDVVAVVVSVIITITANVCELLCIQFSFPSSTFSHELYLS